ncbi:3-phosphoshikimate 1-carboxyvinyltransferase [Tenacibaculum holothuriorum]|uniref:3-phosphoshikimate 1-carboxyvinyltransferase n=1 Tax=Tenacibaculum holothuriorum TaxID=1635173 RepID=A0A1Y2PC36_9FLAO|nr:3-phosphoshikimate 1-carboxyvinyltransferase [Tenacibaculum holothuriorum]OSY87347.1 3-phosphoshikimate 1-carboxyvinyltransferase [Tenacibaculum holothuriorum]
MKIKLHKPNTSLKADLIISGSKSESNRLLILQQAFPNITIENLSTSDDTQVMQKALRSNDNVADIHHAGTAMRFLTAYFAANVSDEIVLTGSQRMKERPIAILVDALQSIGANISYEEQEGYPPLRIKKSAISKDKVAIKGNVSSQYISALILMAPSLPNGLEIELVGEITSVPYIEMTLQLLSQLGIEATFSENKIKVQPKKEVENKTIVVESDWSSASYFYSLIALSEVSSNIKLSAYKEDSLQGDSCLAKIYEHFGVKTEFLENTIVLTKEQEHNPNILIQDLKSAPDIAQTIAVTCFGLGITCDLTGLHTLKIKETDRLEALKNELTKLGAKIEVTNDSLHLKTSEVIHENIEIETYNDHRMAMAFAPLALRVPIQILDAMVVTKSYQSFWDDMKEIGITVQEVK